MRKQAAFLPVFNGKNSHCVSIKDFNRFMISKTKKFCKNVFADSGCNGSLPQRYQNVTKNLPCNQSVNLDSLPREQI